MPIPVLHIINGLGLGGAERSLTRQLGLLNRSRYSPAVISLTKGGHYGSAIKEMGIPLIELDMKSAKIATSVMDIRRFAAARNARIAHAWMYHASLASIFSLPELPLISAIRHSLGDRRTDSVSTKIACSTLKLLQKRVDRFVYVSDLVKLHHEEYGYHEKRSQVIYNGFDSDRFRWDAKGSNNVRRSLDIPDDATVVGSIGRYHPVKDHATLLRVFGALSKDRDDLYLVMAGTGVDQNNSDLRRIAVDHGIEDRVRFLGARTDVVPVLSAFDIFVSASRAESFANAVAEAMLCERMVVCTDVGACSLMATRPSLLARPADYHDLLSRVRWALSLSPSERRSIGTEAREKIKARFSASVEVDQTQALYDHVLHQRGIQPDTRQPS